MPQNEPQKVRSEDDSETYGRVRFGPDQVVWPSEKDKFLEHVATIGSRMGDFENPNNYLAIMRAALEKARNGTFSAGQDKVKVSPDEIQQIEHRVAATVGSQISSKMNPRQYVDQCRRASVSDGEIYDVAMEVVLSRRSYSTNFNPSPDDISFFAKNFNRGKEQVRKDVLDGIMKDYGLGRTGPSGGEALLTKDFYVHIARTLEAYGFTGDEAYMTFYRLQVKVGEKLRAEPKSANANQLHGLSKELKALFPHLMERDSGNLNNLDLPVRLIERSSSGAFRRSTSWTSRRIEGLRKGLHAIGIADGSQTRPLKVAYPRRRAEVEM